MDSTPFILSFNLKALFLMIDILSGQNTVYHTSNRNRKGKRDTSEAQSMVMDSTYQLFLSFFNDRYTGRNTVYHTSNRNMIEDILLKAQSLVMDSPWQFIQFPSPDTTLGRDDKAILKLYFFLHVAYGATNLETILLLLRIRSSKKNIKIVKKSFNFILEPRIQRYFGSQL